MRYSTALFIALAAVLGGAMAILPPIPPTAEEAATITRSHPTPTPIRSPSVGPISLGFHYRARSKTLYL